MEAHQNPAFSGDDVNIDLDSNGLKDNYKNGNSIMRAGSVLSAHNINYTVKVSTGCCGAMEDKKILCDITGIFRVGMNAILGPTGSGKSTFLDYLAGRLDEQHTSGQLLLDGKPTPENFKCMVGYVVQDDVVMGTLTVRENFAFSAALRLPKTVSTKEKRERVEQVIKELGLQKCANTKVGNVFLRGVSGGERKRCNIGMELIISPPVLFLDEPTTGLDANTANTVLMFLRRISRRGRTIIFSIHQPRYSIYRLFDSVTLLSAGHTVFHGPAHETLDFFKEQGFTCEEHNNPPDFFLDVINGDSIALAGTTDADINLEDDTIDASQHDKLLEGYLRSSWNAKLQSDANSIFSNFQTNGGMKGDRDERVDYATSFGTQMVVLAGRSLKNLIRNPQTSVMTLATTLFFGILIGAIFWQLEEDPIKGFDERAGVLFFLIMNQLFMNMSAVELFINERDIFMHENISGFYRVSVYFLVKIFCDLLPLRLVPVFVMAFIVYFAVDLRAGVEYFILFVVVLFSVSIAATSICFLFSSTFRVFAVAQLSLALCYVMSMLFGGFLIGLDSIGVWLNWIQYISIFKYALQAIYINEFKDRVFCSNATFCKTGNEFLDNQDMDYGDDWDFWQNIMALFLIAFGCLVITYIQLRRMKKHK